MTKAGIREARQNLSALLEMVKKGREVVLTDRGKSVARLVPARPSKTRGVPDLAGFRRSMPVLVHPLSAAIVEDREDRL